MRQAKLDTATQKKDKASYPAIFRRLRETSGPYHLSESSPQFWEGYSRFPLRCLSEEIIRDYPFRAPPTFWRPMGSRWISLFSSQLYGYNDGSGCKWRSVQILEDQGPGASERSRDTREACSFYSASCDWRQTRKPGTGTETPSPFVLCYLLSISRLIMKCSTSPMSSLLIWINAPSQRWHQKAFSQLMELNMNSMS